MTTMHQSNVKEIFKFTDALVFAKMGKHLSDVQRLLIQTAWFKPGQRYDEIARETGYSATYLKQDAGPKLWRLLSDILGEKVKKSNFRAAMERQASVLPELSSPVATALQESSLPTPSDSSAALQKDDEGEIVHQSQIDAIHRYQDCNLQKQQEAFPWIPDELSPFKHEENLEPLNSLGLRYEKEVVGWVITHRLSPDTIRYTCSYIRPDLQKVGRILSLYAESIKLQAAKPEIPNAIWTVPFKFKSMANFVKKRMGEYMDSVEESRGSLKSLIEV